jgi:hypothetical protein
MAEKTIVDFLHDWMRSKPLREKVLHKEKTEMGSYGLDDAQIKELRNFRLLKIAKRMADELGLDLDDLREAVYGPDDPSGAGAVGAAAYDEGRTHIRRVVPAIVSRGVASEVVLWGHGFKSDKTKVTVEFLNGPPPPTTVAGVVTDVQCGIDVWQRITVQMTLNQTGDWTVRAHNDDDETPPPGSGNWIWSDPVGRVHVV